MSTFSLPTLTGTNLKHTKAYNLRIVMETIRTHCPVARADIARQTKLTPQTVSNIVGELLANNLVKETDQRRQGRGAPSTMLKINADVAFSVGLDLDHDHLTGVILDLEGNVRHREHEKLDLPSPSDALDRMEAMAQTLIQQADINRTIVSGVGVGIPGPLRISENSRVSNALSPENFPGWKSVPVASELKERLSLPIYLENTATAASVGELWYGAGKAIKTFFYFYFGARLGGGLVIDGRPYRGHNKNAGELSYLPKSLFSLKRYNDPKSAIIGEGFHLPHLYRRLNEAGNNAHLPADLETLFNEGNSLLLDWIEQTVGLLTPLVVMVDYMIDPEAFFLGGRLPEPIISAILNGLADALEDHGMPGQQSSPGLLEAAAKENAAALGVATLPVYELFAPLATHLANSRSNSDVNNLFVPRP